VLRIALERELVALPLAPAGVELAAQPEIERAH
jgi:hypothetical protein